MNAEGPETLIEAVTHFSDPQICHEYMVNLKWPDGKITCPKCGSDKIGQIATRCMLRCNAVNDGKRCGKQFSVKVGTIFEDSPLPLCKWFVAVWIVINAKNGVSSYEIHRALGVTQKTAWFMDHRIRLAMQTGSFRKFHDVVESDETYIGGLGGAGRANGAVALSGSLASACRMVPGSGQGAPSNPALCAASRFCPVA